MDVKLKNNQYGKVNIFFGEYTRRLTKFESRSRGFVGIEVA